MACDCYHIMCVDFITVVLQVRKALSDNWSPWKSELQRLIGPCDLPTSLPAKYRQWLRAPRKSRIICAHLSTG